MMPAAAPPYIARRVENGWRNYHETVTLGTVETGRFEGLETEHWEEAAPDWTPHDFAAAVAAVQALLASRPTEVLAVGAAWSHERLLQTTRGVLLDGTQAGGAMALGPGDVEGADDPLALIAGGARVQALSGWLERRGSMLRTSGSHGAPSLAGALATGTHGARLGRRGIEEHVRGMLLVTGPDTIAWIAPTDGPRISQSLLDGVAPGASRIEDDDVFAASLSHLGGLGYVAAVLVAAEPRRFFIPVRRAVPLWRGWEKAWATGQQEDIAARIWRGRSSTPPPPLIACELNLNPWSLATGTGCFALRFDGGRPRPRAIEPQPEFPPIDILGQIEPLIENGLIPDDFSLPAAFEALFALQQTKGDPAEVVRGSWGELLKPDQGIESQVAQIWSGAIAVPQKDVHRALAVLGHASAKMRKRFLFCLRPVNRSRAALGFCRWAETTVINVDGFGKRWSSDTDELENTVRGLAAKLHENSIEHAMHWGKLGTDGADDIRAIYGPASDPTTGLGKWFRARRVLLASPGSDLLFSSAWLRKAGLA